MHPETIRRRENGTIDIDFYRRRALSDRAATITSGGLSIGRSLRATIASVRDLLVTASRSQRLPDPGAMMLVAQAAIKRPPI